MKVAIIGAGFCGLAVAWNLFNQFPSSNLNVTLFDSKKIGEGTSGIAAGLLHPYAGLHAKLNWRGVEAFEESRVLLKLAANHSKEEVIADNLGILRLASTLQQQIDYQKSPALLDPYVAWLNEQECQEKVSGCIVSPALWIKNGLTVYCEKYLQGLWGACETKGARFQQHSVASLAELDNYSLVIITAGALSTTFEETKNIPLNIVKGQVLELSWPTHLPPLSYALNSQAYIVMKQDNKSCLVGSSYERANLTTDVDLKIATKEILPKAIHLLPSLKDSEIICGYAGLRAVTPNHLPFFREIKKNCWILTGMGSKGLLYHALMAKELVKACLAIECE